MVWICTCDVMELIPVTFCDLSLNFHSRQRLSSPLPPVSWEKYLLTHFDAVKNGKEQNALNFSSRDTSFSHLFFRLHPELSLPDLAKVTKKILPLRTQLNVQVETDFLSLYGVGSRTKQSFLKKDTEQVKVSQDCQSKTDQYSSALNSSPVKKNSEMKTKPETEKRPPVPCVQKQPENASQDMQTLLGLLNTPLAFQNWLSQKKVVFHQLRPLKLIGDIQVFHDLFKWIGRCQPTQAQGLLILEWSVELLLMKKFDLFPACRAFHVEQMLSRLELKRKPVSFNKDRTVRERLKNLVHPPNVKSQWERRGDETGIKLTLWSKDQKHLLRQLQQIQGMDFFEITSFHEEDKKDKHEPT